MADQSSVNRRGVFYLCLSAMASMAAANTDKALSKNESLMQDNQANWQTLRKKAASKGLIYGAAGRASILSTKSAFAEKFSEECGILVPESELKWKALRPQPDGFDFERSDRLLEFAQAYNLYYRGHTLIWHKALPSWFEATVNRQNAERFLVKHVSTVAKRYSGQMHSWDVVNEAIEPNHGRADGLKKTPWLEFLGPEYIDLAFRVAADADPQALLVYNDFGLSYGDSKDEAKREAVLQLLYRLKAMGTPIHALGIQAHLRAKETRFSAEKLKDFLRHVGSLDLKILITEMDVSDQGLPQDIETRDRIVAQVYYDYLSVVLSEPAVIGVLTWGLSDRYTWLSNYRPRSDSATVRPLPLDKELQRKPAWTAIARAFDAAPMRL